MNLQKNNPENFFIINYIQKTEYSNNKKEVAQKHRTLESMFQELDKKRNTINYENFFTTKRPVSLQEARVDTKLPKGIEGHIIVCGIVKGIKDLVLPLRCKSLGSQKRPIVIISNDNIDGDTYIWPEINRFTDIFIIRGSALNPAVLENAMAHKAKSIIIIATQLDTKDEGG